MAYEGVKGIVWSELGLLDSGTIRKALVGSSTTICFTIFLFQFYIFCCSLKF
jgi:hypothetical protein